MPVSGWLLLRAQESGREPEAGDRLSPHQHPLSSASVDAIGQPPGPLPCVASWRSRGLFSQEDIRDYVYRIKLRERLAVFLGLPLVKVGRLLAKLSSPPDGLSSFDPTAEFSQCFAVLPMGFSWAFYIAQDVQRGFAERFIPGALSHHFIVERKPAPVLGAPGDKAVLLYSDNSHHMSLLAEEANSMREALSRVLDGHGLPTHEIVEASHMSEALGASIGL